MIRRRRWRVHSWMLALFLLAALAGCSGEEEAAAELAAIRTEYAEADLSAAEKRRAFTPRYQTLVKDHWGTEAALDASLWLMQTAARTAFGEDRTQVVGAFTDSILAEYAESPTLWKVAEHASLYSEEQQKRYFEDLLEDSPYPAVRAAAIFYPAQLKMRILRPRRPPNLRMPSNMTEGDGGDPPELDPVKADLRLVMEEYGDLPAGHTTYGAMADAILNVHTEEELAIGQPAPEIVGKTVDGKEMRLTDFRGRVTVIDFWGDW